MAFFHGINIPYRFISVILLSLIGVVMVQITAEVQKMKPKVASKKISSFTKQKEVKDIVIPVPLMEKGQYLVVTIPSEAVQEMLDNAGKLPTKERVDFINNWIKDNIHMAIDEYVEKGKKKFTVDTTAPKIKATPTPKPLPYTYEEKGQKYLVLKPKKAELKPVKTSETAAKVAKITKPEPAPKAKETKIEAPIAKPPAPKPPKAGIPKAPTTSKAASMTVPKVEIESAKPSKPKIKTTLPEAEAELPKYKPKESAEEKMAKSQNKWVKDHSIQNLTPSSSHQGKNLKTYYGKGFKFIANIKTGKSKEKHDALLPVDYRVEGGGQVVKVLFIIQIPTLLTSKDVMKMASQMADIISSYPTSIKGVSKIQVKKDMETRLTKALKNAGYEIM